jgi:hypothetical protein
MWLDKWSGAATKKKAEQMLGFFYWMKLNQGEDYKK